MNGAARALASARGHRLVLVYHRLGVRRSGGLRGRSLGTRQPVQSAAAGARRGRRLCGSRSKSLQRTGVDRAVTSTRPAVAVTFDDDLPSHAEHALPVLRELGVPATFFLSGRALHGLGAYWFQHLEALLIAYGERRTAALLSTPESSAATSGAGLRAQCGSAAACERTRRRLAGSGHSPTRRDCGVGAQRA